MSQTVSNRVETLLAILRDKPVNSEQLDDGVLGEVYSYLIGIPSTSSGDLHWFCEKADIMTVDAATFLLRLFAYNSDPVDVWKERLQQCLNCCSSCVRGLETAKVVSQTTFLGAFNIVQVNEFINNVEGKELEFVLKDVLDAGFTPALTLNQQKTLAELPPAIVYRMVSNWTIFCDSRIQSILHTYAPSDCSTGWPTDPLPPGMFVLLIVANPLLRTWARSHASSSSLISTDEFLGSHVNALGVLAHAIHASHSGPAQAFLGTTAPPIPLNTQLMFAEPRDLWSGFHFALRLTPPELLTSTSRQRINIGRIVTSHLHDQGPHFVEVLKCFILVVKRLGKSLWNGEGPEYPQVVFDAIKDNPAFLELLQSNDASQHGIWHLAWFQEFLLTIRGHQVFGDVLAKLIDLLCEEAQHERFGNVRPAVLKSAISILSSDFRRCRDSNRNQLDVVLNILDIHPNIIVLVAYANDYHVASWKDARDSARHLVEEVLSADIQEITRATKSLCLALARVKQDTAPDALPILTIRTQMWKKLYSTSPTQDTTAIASIICIVSKAAHLDSIRSPVFSKQWKLPKGDQLLDKVNQSLHTIQSGFLGLISTFSDYGVSTSALEVLRCVGAGKAVIMLLLSPIEDFQVAAQILIGLAFDVDGRMDCFRALLENLPVEALDGIFDFLVTFERYAATLPEACSLSKTLVRCFTDIVEVLCTSPDGLLQSSLFLRSNDDQGPAARMLQFWKLTTKALSTIYKRTPMWAPYFDTQDMVVWMRDALILARDMLSHWRVIENAANTFTKAPAKSATSGKVSRIGQQMVGVLQEFLPELVRWLRLTDEELLHQSFALLQSLLDLMKNVRIQPSETGLSKLRKHVEGAMNNTKIREDRTRLDSARLAKLADVLAYFDEEDEVEIVSHTISSKPSVKEEKIEPIQEPRPYIQGKARSSKITGHFAKTSLPYVHSSSSSAKSFSKHDRQTLDSQAAIPAFRRMSTTMPVATVGSSKTVPPNQRLHSKNEPKNEAASRNALSESSDSSESDSDEENLARVTGISALGRIPKFPRDLKQVERRQIKTLDIPLRTNPIQERLLHQKQQRNAALRLRPDISDLHRALLSWDYTHVGPEPPGDKIQLTHVPDRFESYEEYFKIFQPLLLMECWAQLLQSKEEKQIYYQCKVESRLFSDDWLDINLSISESVRRDWYLAETDIVLLRHLNQIKCTMAKVKSYIALPTGIQLTVRCYTKSGPGDPGLQVTTLWQISKVFSLSTLHREYAALLSLQYNDLCDFILRPSLTKAPEVDAKDLKYTMDEFKVNEPQATAILKAMNTEGFSLIQGPPGTGKTSTICGLVTHFISQNPRLNAPIHVPLNQPWKLVPQGKSLGGKKILLCAPSNAAIDEIAQRIKDGYTGSQRKTNTINVVRVGAEQAMNMSVRDISLDYLVDQKLNVNSKPLNDIGNEIKATRVEIEAVKEARKLRIEELSGTHDNGARTVSLENEVRQLNSKRQALITKLDRMKDQQKSDSRTLDTLRRNTRREILTQADIVCSTLSGSGHELLSDIEFEMIIIDEAAQSIELSSLIPLKFGCNRCIMVGDPQQLPPTVLSQEASRFAYNQSLFVRLQKSRQDAVHLLSIQYRMHPDISRLPSRVFYGGRLLDGPDMKTKTKQPWHVHKKFGTYKFFNVSNGIEESNRHSIKNQSECHVAAALFNRLHHEFPSINFDFRVGVVSMYRAQIVELRRHFEQRFGKELVGKIDFNTVDGFQGQEKDIIILSCVRAGPGLQSIGFLSDTRRMNVALTRAKSSLFILGNASTLERSDGTWRQIIEDARSSSSLVDVDVSYFARPASPTPVTASPKKRPKIDAAPIQQTPVPQDLATPQQLMTASVQNTPQPTSSAVHRPTPTIDETVVPGNKRPADTGSISVRAPQPEPLRKRQKTQPNIFIPKKRT